MSEVIVAAAMHYRVGWHDDAGPGWWLFMALMMLAFWGAVAWVVVTLVRHGGARPSVSSSTTPPAARTGPEDILHERFARGEIDVEEYHQRIDALRAKRPA